MTQTEKAFMDYYYALYPEKRPKQTTLKIQLKMRNLLYSLFCVATAMVGYTIHGSLFWAVLNFFFAPLSIIWWLIQHELTLTVLKQTFDFLNK